MFPRQRHTIGKTQFLYKLYISIAKNKSFRYHFTLRFDTEILPLRLINLCGLYLTMTTVSLSADNKINLAPIELYTSMITFLEFSKNELIVFFQFNCQSFVNKGAQFKSLINDI